MTTAHPHIYCVLTADYELFLGKNFYDHDTVLFEPTRRLLDAGTRARVPITLFADVCSVFAHRKFSRNEYVEKFEEQLRAAIAGGHDVQLHLHPHWLNSTYENGSWVISTERMYLHEFGYDEGDDTASVIIGEGVRYLEDLLGGIDSNYRCAAFRAAGLALQPGERKLIAALLEQGIGIDSSVAKNIRLKMDTVEMDYSGIPSQANWRMAPATGIAVPADEGLFEVPIATFRSSLMSRIGFLVRRARSISMRRGAGISRATRQTKFSMLRSLLLYNWRYVSTNPWFLFSCDTKGLTLSMLSKGFDDYIDRHADSGDIYVSMINHPKMMFEQQFELLDQWIRHARDRYGEQIRFVTFRDITEKIGSN